MQRRDFFKQMGTLTIGVFIGGNLLTTIKADPNNNIANPDLATFPEEELRKALMAHFNKFYNGEMLNINDVPVSSKGKALIASVNLVDGFDFEIIKNKNTIFDVADSVIEFLDKEANFDASDLKNRRIPEKLTIMPGGVAIYSGIQGIYQIESLKNYDAKIILKNPILIRSKFPMKDWNKIKATELKKTIFPNKKTTTQNYSTEDKLSFSITKIDKDNAECIAVKKITPNLVIDNHLFFSNFVSKEKGLSFLSEDVQEFIKKL